MKFFLVISIIAFWWVPMNSPGNIGMLKLPLSTELIKVNKQSSNSLRALRNSMTKRKMDHFNFQNRKHLLRKELD